ncbi:MAG: ribonuclease R [Bacteroidia bacterium]|nr:ribonuclease R [Bacteroidia bacterium]
MAKSKKKQVQRFLFEEVIAFLKHNADKAFNYKQVAAAMEIDNESERFTLLETLEALKHQGFVIEKEIGKYQVKDTKSYLSGTIDFTTQGTAYVVTEAGEKDVFIAFRKTKDALQGDLVKINVFNRRGNPEGEVIEVIKRAKTKFVGTIQVMPKFAFVVPDYNKLHVDFFVPLEHTLNAKNGQKVVVELTEWKRGSENPNGKIVEVLGNAGEHETEIHAIMAEYGLPMHFSEKVENEAKQIDTKIKEQEISKRRDFRNITTFTIDPADAKDFDDALSLQKLSNGHWEIGVHIADVTHYVKPGTILDDEAVNRATSVYLVDRCVPMLPEVLSNFACSLRPNEEKYCFSAVFEMDDKAKIYQQWFGKTVINSNHRFTYEEAQTIIETEQGIYKDEILTLDRLAKLLRAERTAHGSIFFDKAEVKFHLDDDGTPTGVYFKTQKDAHKLIEDFMLLANRKVAEFLAKGDKTKNTEEKNHKKKKEESKEPVIYRIHDVPKDDKLLELNQFVERFGYSVAVGNKQKTAQSINKLLTDVKNKKEQSMIELLAVRSMPKAVYTTKNVGHYGLGFEYYTHFTSPIRRYPDMLVHRLLEAKLNHTHYLKADELELLAKHSSDMERLAADAERASVKYKQVEYLEDKIGDEFDGIISGVTEWGIFVEIIENKCEGRVGLRDIKDDQYVFDEENYRVVGRRSGRIYSLGDKVRIKVKRADLIKKQLDFEFVSGESSKKEIEIRNPKRYKKRK